MTTQEVEEMLMALRQPDTLLQSVDQVMQAIQQMRATYLTSEKGRASIQTETERKRYQKDWVANFEISDWLVSQRNENVVFARTIDLDNDQEHEELERMSVQQPFEDQALFLDSSDGKGGQTLQHCSTWLEGHPLQAYHIRKPVFIADGRGHFFVMKPTLVTDSKQPDTPPREVLIVLNSTKALQLHKGIVEEIYRLVFDRQAPAKRQGNYK
jgi:hypothetical protein